MFFFKLTIFVVYLTFCDQKKNNSCGAIGTAC